MPGVRWSHLAGIGLLGGIGFTVSLFITELAFTDALNIVHARIGIFAASLLAGVLGIVVLRWASRGTVHAPSSPHD